MRKLMSISAAVVLGLSYASTALAAPPTVILLPPVSFDDPFLCSGDPVIHVEYSGTFRLSLYTDRNGNLIRDAITGQGSITVTFSAAGKSLTSESPAPFRTTYASDGSVDTLTASGLNAAVTIPGSGVVLLDTGSITWAGGFGGSLVGSAGPHVWFLGGDTSAFCAYFA
jgi:hypothetical protein